ncbi:hypothetical protein QNI16_15315 [Cytophagaceae bacterium YF14B1]|uniref:Uncharacterized protein n=1 Tax=Xanthocytophaga flava TaxID=3048013 RepID=A0AAE3QS64_9BACT|nr:hypothetical protein [Xanthocytophaga flavus]MDJ1481869.1 hypothetical protein [Xanthocytophaga flavus]
MKTQTTDYTLFRVIGDDSDLTDAIDYCNKYKRCHLGVLAEAARRMSNPPTDAQISNVLCGKAAYTHRNLEILYSVYTAVKLEVKRTEELRDKFKK